MQLSKEDVRFAMNFLLSITRYIYACRFLDTVSPHDESRITRLDRAPLLQLYGALVNAERQGLGRPTAFMPPHRHFTW